LRLERGGEFRFCSLRLDCEERGNVNPSRTEEYRDLSRCAE